MRKTIVVLLLAGAGATLAVAALATAAGGSKDIRARGGLVGYEEVGSTGSISTTGNGTFSARVAPDDSSFHWKLTFEALEGTVTQSHIHFGQRATNGGISIWLCGTAASPGPPGTATCPAGGGTVTGTATPASVVGPAAQGIEPGAWAEILAAIRAGYAYANVHSTKWPTGEIRGQLNEGNDQDDSHDDD